MGEHSSWNQQGQRESNQSGKGFDAITKVEEGKNDWSLMSEKRMVCPEEPDRVIPSRFLFLILWKPLKFLKWRGSRDLLHFKTACAMWETG